MPRWLAILIGLLAIVLLCGTCSLGYGALQVLQDPCQYGIGDNCNDDEGGGSDQGSLTWSDGPIDGGFEVATDANSIVIMQVWNSLDGGTFRCVRVLPNQKVRFDGINGSKPNGHMWTLTGAEKLRNQEWNSWPQKPDANHCKQLTTGEHGLDVVSSETGLAVAWKK